jgi:hypothetical protein
MGSIIEFSDGHLSSKIKAKKECLEKAKKILLTTGECIYDNSTISSSSSSSYDEKSQAFVASLAGLHDSLQEILSESLQEVQSITISSSPTRKTPFESMYSQFYRLRWSSMKGDRNRNNRNECTNDIDNDTMARNIFGLEADLYRAMWLSCLILLSSINNTSNRDRDHYNSRKRSIRELNNNLTGDANRSRKIVLERTIRQCRLLVSLLEQIIAFQQPDSKIVYGDNHTATKNQSVDHCKNIWDDRILEWTKNNSDDDDDDDSLNILSFTKEELEKEEQQLCYMAATPIPTVDTRNLQQKQCLTFNNASTNNGDANETNRLLIGRLLIENAAEGTSFSLSSSVPIELDDRGILRATTGSSTTDDKDGIVDNSNEKCRRWWWSLTSQSVVLCDDKESPNKIQINNVISFRTSDLTTIALDVGRDSTLWQGHVSRIQANVTYGHEQEEIEKLWPVNEVIAAQIKARELFVGKIQEGK